MTGFMPSLSPDLTKELANELNKLINIPFLNEKQEQMLLEFLIELLQDKLNLLKSSKK